MLLSSVNTQLGVDDDRVKILLSVPSEQKFVSCGPETNSGWLTSWLTSIIVQTQQSSVASTSRHVDQIDLDGYSQSNEA